MKARYLLFATATFLAGGAGVAAQEADFSTVSEDMLRDPAPGDWLNWRWRSTRIMVAPGG